MAGAGALLCGGSLLACRLAGRLVFGMLCRGQSGEGGREGAGQKERPPAGTGGRDLLYRSDLLRPMSSYSGLCRCWRRLSSTTNLSHCRRGAGSGRVPVDVPRLRRQVTVCVGQVRTAMTARRVH